MRSFCVLLSWATNNGILILPTEQGTCCTCLLPTYLGHLQSKPVTWVPVTLVCLLWCVRTLKEKCLFSYKKNLKGCNTSFKTPFFFLCGCNYSYIYCQYSEVHHILYNLTNAVNKMQDYRIKCTEKYLSGISLTDFLKSLFIPMRYKTNTAFFSIWISLKITQSKSVF